jgi:5-methylcytosine-specific restriction endonuclease McrA
MRTEQVNSKNYGELLRTVQWQEKRKQILKRDSYQCRNCGSSYGLEVHHRQYHKIKCIGDFRKPWAYPDSNLVTLCARCHQVGHKKYTVPVFNV